MYTKFEIEIQRAESTMRARGERERNIWTTKSELSPHSAKTFKNKTINLRKLFYCIW